MRVTIIAPGSRGDIQPYLGLGVGLTRAGHAVRVVTTMDHDTLVKSFGLELASVPVNVQAALQSKATSEALQKSNLASLRMFKDIALKAARLTAEIGLEASRGCDVLVAGFAGAFLGEGIARRLGVPLVQAYNVPLTPTAAFPGALTPWLDFGPRSRRFGHALARMALWTTARMSANDARMQVLSAPSAPLTVPRRFAGLVEGPVLYGFSPTFLPRGPEWGDDVEVTGFWFTDDPPGFTPPPALEEFLAAGPAPVCIGFGSMSQTDPRAAAELVLEAVQQAGVRAVLLAGWGGLTAKQLPSTVLALDGAPHSWLYPKCSAVVHHGGAGTTAAALRAGVPAVVVPFHGDQPFWAQRVHASGTGPRPILRRKLTAAGLANALREATSDVGLSARASALGEAVRAEGGVGRAVEAITRLAAR
jgi:sterol 3beta-glucosyltransferase